MIIEYTNTPSYTAETVNVASYSAETTTEPTIDDECLWKIQYNPLILEAENSSGDQVPITTEGGERLTTEEGHEI